MTVCELFRHILKKSSKTANTLFREWPFGCSLKTLYNRETGTSGVTTDSCDVHILRYAFHNGFTTEAIEVIARKNHLLSPYLRAALLYPDLSLGEITAITDILRVSPDLVLTDDAIRGIVLRRRAEVASSTFPGS